MLIGQEQMSATRRAAPGFGIGYELAFHEKAGRSQAECLSIHTYKQGFPPPS